MKKLIIVTLITTCAALCAAVWPHNNATEQTPVPSRFMRKNVCRLRQCEVSRQ